MKIAHKAQPPGHPVLIMNVIDAGFGGQETHVLNLYKRLSDRGRRPLLLVIANSPLHRRILQTRLRCYAVPHYRLPGSYRLLSLLLTAVLLWVCKRHGVQVIHCNNRFDLRSALWVAKLLEVRVILNYHITTEFDAKILKGADAFVAPGPLIVGFVAEQNRAKALGLREVRVLPPLFDANKFTEYQSMASPAEWFRATFGIEIKPCPIVCTIGNMVQDLQHKNYPLLFEALAILIRRRERRYKRSSPVTVPRARSWRGLRGIGTSGTTSISLERQASTRPAFSIIRMCSFLQAAEKRSVSCTSKPD